jgi:transposase
LAYCLVHARRNFVKVHKTTNSPFAQEVIERIGAVYAIEARIRGCGADERRAVRQAETKPLMEALKVRLEAVKDGISRQSTLIKAIDYMLERWTGLTAFLDDGRLEPDTNTVERTIRPISIGKKNSLFSGNEGGGETWAILASLLNTAKLNGVDPEAYLADVLERMVSGRTKHNQLHKLLVWNWKAAREAERRAAA